LRGLDFNVNIIFLQNKEAQYAFTKNKPIVPLMMESSYRPEDGWLGLLIGGEYYVDFESGQFEQSMNKMIQQLELRQIRPSQIDL
jgi:hypothetical protein